MAEKSAIAAVWDEKVGHTKITNLQVPTGITESPRGTDGHLGTTGLYCCAYNKVAKEHQFHLLLYTLDQLEEHTSGGATAHLHALKKFTAERLPVRLEDVCSEPVKKQTTRRCSVITPQHRSALCGVLVLPALMSQQAGQQFSVSRGFGPHCTCSHYTTRLVLVWRSRCRRRLTQANRGYLDGILVQRSGAVAQWLPTSPRHTSTTNSYELVAPVMLLSNGRT